MRSWLAQARKNAGLTMADVAEKLGVTEGYYSMIEAGKRQKKLDITLAARFSEIFELPIESIVTYEAEQK